MNEKEVIELLNKSLKEISRLEKLSVGNQDVILWRNSIEDVLEEVCGRDSTEYKRFHETRKKWRKLTKEQKQRQYTRQLRERQTVIRSIIRKIELFGLKAKPAITVLPSKAFIAHEGETRALTMLKEFLEALGIQYFIAESKASDGRSIEKQVQWTQGKADFAIILATKGKAINKKTGKSYMGLNVADELGRAREVFKNRIILLVQKGVEVHTIPREIVRETFTTTNMENAFIKIVKELKNWGFLTTERIEEQT